jgi:DNA-binding CsgD family transcriptional regulator
VPVPAALAEGFLRRARAVGPSATTLLALVEAAAGDLRVVLSAAAVLRLEPGLLTRLEGAALLSTSGDRIAFTHPLVGSSAYASLTPDRRRQVHSAVVASLPASDVTRRAWHAAAAVLGPDVEAAGALEAVGVDARRRGAYAVAASALERAAQLTDDGSVRADRGVAAAAAAFDAGDSGWALRLLDAAMTEDVSATTRSRAGALRGAITTRSGSLGEAWTTLMAAAREVADSDPDQALHLVADAVGVAFYLANGDVALESQQLAESLLDRGVDRNAAAIGRLAVGMAQVLGGRDGSAQLREGARLLSGEAPTETREFDSAWLALGALFLRDDGSTRRLLHAVEEARADTSVGALPHLLFHLARDEATTERWAAAESDYTEAASLAEELGQSTEAAIALAGLAWLEARRGKEDASREHAARAAAIAEPRQIMIARIWAGFALGDVELGAGRMDQALDRYASVVTLLKTTGIRDVDLSPAPELAEALLRAGDTEQATAVAAEYRIRAEAKGAPWALARAWRTVALLAPEDDVDAAFEQALCHHAQTLDVFETARTHLAYGARLRRARRRVDARERLQDAYRAFERLGAQPWAETAADELAATGITVAPRGATGLDLLTPRERQIVHLLLDGRTTREAAGALFLSPKTVEYHLRHVYTKLGITNRRELADLVGSGG